MTSAELNILITVRAKAARDAVNKLQGAVTRLDIAMKAATTSFSNFVGAASGASTGIRMFTAAMADLSKALSIIAKSNASRKIDLIGANSGTAAPAVLELAVAMELLNKQIMMTAAIGGQAAVALNALKSAAAGTVAAASAATAATTKIAGANAAMSASAAGAAKSQKNVADAAAKSSKGLDLYSSSASRAARETAATRASASALGDGIASADTKTSHWSQTMGGHANQLSKWGSQMQWAGRQMSLYFTAPMALAIGMGAKWQLDLERQQTNLKKVYDAGLGDNINDSTSKTARQFEILTQKLRELSDETGTSQEEITEMAAAWAQAGKSGKELLEYTQLTNKAMIVGDMTAQESAEGMQALALQWGFTGKKSKEGISEIQGALQGFNLASNITQVSMKDLFEGMSRTGAQARDAGLSFNETTAILTALTRVTGSAATAGNGLKSIAINIRGTSRVMPDLVKKVYNITNGMLDMDSAAYQALSTMEKFEYISKISKNLDTQRLTELNFALFGKYQAARGAQINKDLNDIAGNIVKVTKALESGTGRGSQSFKQWQQELETFFSSNPQKFKIASTAIKNSLMDIGVIALPYILEILQTIAKLAKAFTELPEGVQKAAIAFGVLLAFVGPLAMIIGAFNVLFGTLGKTIAFFGRNFTKAGAQAAAAAKGLDTSGNSALTLQAKVKKAAKSVFSSVTGFIVAPFKKAAASVSVGSKQTAAAAAAGSRATSAAWASGMAGIPASTAAAGNAAAAANAAAGKRVITSTAGMTAAEIKLAQEKGRLLVAEEVKTGTARVAATKTSGASQVAAVATNQQAMLFAEQQGFARRMAAEKAAELKRVSTRLAHLNALLAQSQIASNREIYQQKINDARLTQSRLANQLAMYNRLAAVSAAGEAKLASTIRAGGVAQATAAAANGRAVTAAYATGSAGTLAAGKKAGENAAEGTKKGFKGKLGGGLGTLLTVAMFIPPGMFSKIGGMLKSGFNSVIKSVPKLFAAAGEGGAKNFGKGFVRSLGGKGGLVGTAIAALVGGIIYAFDDIKKVLGKIWGSDSKVPFFARPFVSGTQIIIKAVSKLPQVIADVFSGIVKMIVSAAKAVYKAFSYINPFARHSPSLVENVQNGMAVVTSTFADADRSIQASLHSSYGAISKFGTATAGLKGKAKGIEMENTTADLNKADPTGGAAQAYRALDAQANRLQGTLVKLNAAMIRQKTVVSGLETAVAQADKNIAQMQQTMDGLQKIADAVGKALDYAKEQLDYYANAPLKGMKAMNDAIFENEMAQKKLRLEIMKLEDAGESVDDLKDKYAKLQGQIETLSGERNALQAKGAGSDILATYDKMIADLKAQQNAQLAGPSSEVEKLNKQLDELSRKGEMLDLENSLKFDPLKKQISDVVNAEKELDFNTAINGARNYKAQVDILTVANNVATAATNMQQSAIDNATAARDRLQQKLDGEKGKLDQLQTTYDQTSTAIDDTRSAMDEITTAASTVNQRLDEIKQKQDEAANAANDAKNALDLEGQGINDLGNDIGNLDTALDNTDLKLPEIDTSSLDNLFPDVGEKLGKIGESIGKFFKELPGKIMGWLRQIGPSVLSFLKQLPTMLIEAGSDLLGYVPSIVIKFVIAIIVAIGKAVMAGWEWFFTELGELKDKLFKWISEIDWSQVLKNIVELIANPEKQAELLEKLNEIGFNIVSGILGGIGSAIAGIGQWIYEHILTPFVQGIKDAFGIESPSRVMMEFGTMIIMGLLNGIISFGGKVIDWFRELPGKIGNALSSLGSSIAEKFSQAWNFVKEKWNEWVDPIIEKFKQLPDLIGQAFGKIKEIVKEPIRVVVNTVYTNGIRKVWNAVATKIGLPEMPEVEMRAKGGTVGNRIVGPGTGTSDSILTTATPGSEIFTAREVANAGGFRGLEKLLGTLGVSSFANSSGPGVPVALSNGEFRLDPRQVAQMGGAAKVKELRAKLASGEMPGHGIGGLIKDVVTAPMDKAKDVTRSAAAKTVEAGLNLVEKAIPDLDGHGELGKAPKKLFAALKDKIVSFIRGNELKGAVGGGGLRANDIVPRALGGTIPRFAAGGSVTGTTTTAPAATTGAAPAAGGVGETAADGAGLAASVQAATDAAQLIWQQYIIETETALATMQTTITTQSATWQAADIAAFTAYTAQKSALQLAANALFLSNETLLSTQLTTLWTNWRTAETAAQSAWYSSTLSAFSTFSTSFTAQVDNLLNDLEQKFSETRITITEDFNGLVTDMKTTVDGPLTEVFTAVENLLTTAVENFQTAVTDIGTAWNGIKKATGDPVNFTITNVYNGGLMGVWNGVAELIGANKMKEAMPVQGLRSGGPVRGGISEKRDTVPAVLAKNEYVLSASAVKRAGGVENLNRFNFGRGGPEGMFNIGGDWKVHLVTGGPADPGSPSWKALQRGHMYARRVAPGPYVWGGSTGGVKGGGTDCSGWQSEIADVIMGGPGGQRRWATASFPGGGSAQGGVVRIGNQIWMPGLGAGHSIGVSSAHTAGTLGGVPGLPTLNIEAGGGTGRGPTYGAPAVGADSGQFPSRYHLAIADGAFVSGGGAAGASMVEILSGMAKPGLEAMVAKAKEYPITGLASQVPIKTAETWSSQTLKKLEEEGKKLDAAGPGVSGGGGVERWRGMVIAALKRQGFAATPAEVNAMLGQIYDESKGDPNAVNNWDINAQNGTPSRGLLQTIPSTFETWRDPSIPGGITDPWANMNAALRYYRATYGNDLTTHWGRGKGGYDSGGWLPDTSGGYGTYYNHTGEPEAVLTGQQWRDISAAASRPAVTVETISQGFVDGLSKVFGLNTDKEITDVINAGTEVALEGQNATWNPLIVDAADATTTAVNSTTTAVNEVAKETYKVTDTLGSVVAVNTEMSETLKQLTAVMTAASTSASSMGVEVNDKGEITGYKATFGAFAPLITAVGDLIAALPDAEPTYVSWAGTNAALTDEMKREKQMNDIANGAKGLYYAFKTIAPPVLKHTAIIGSAVEQLITQDAAGWAAVSAGLATGNPTAILGAILLGVKAIVTLLPLIINAIMDIGPAIIQSLIAWLTKFEPDSVYAYGTYDAANQAVNDNLTAIQNGATAPTFETVQQGNTEYQFNLYGDINVNADSSTTADSFVSNLLGLVGV